MAEHVKESSDNEVSKQPLRQPRRLSGHRTSSPGMARLFLSSWLLLLATARRIPSCLLHWHGLRTQHLVQPARLRARPHEGHGPYNVSHLGLQKKAQSI